MGDGARHQLQETLRSAEPRSQQARLLLLPTLPLPALSLVCTFSILLLTGALCPACLPAMLPHTLWSLLLLSVFSSFVRAQGPVQTLFPASMPLAVKHPYMSVWYKSVNNAAPLSDSWPYFWGQQVSIPVNILRSLQLAIADGAVGYGLGRQDQSGRDDLQVARERLESWHPREYHEHPVYAHKNHLRHDGRSNERHCHFPYSDRSESPFLARWLEVR